MTTQAPPTSLLPLTPEQLARLQATIGDYSPTQLAWLSGYFWGMVNQQPGAVAIAPVAPAAAAGITIISAGRVRQGGVNSESAFRLGNVCVMR